MGFIEEVLADLPSRLPMTPGKVDTCLKCVSTSCAGARCSGSSVALEECGATALIAVLLSPLSIVTSLITSFGLVTTC